MRNQPRPANASSQSVGERYQFPHQANHGTTSDHDGYSVFLWLNIPSAVAQVGSLADPVVAVATTLMGALSVVAWLAVSVDFGAWLRRHRNTIAELKSVLVRIDAELDMRKPLSAFGNRALLRTLISQVHAKLPCDHDGDNQ
ncbi:MULTISPECIES: hypothetical protein [unclassified Pseudoxanthomonas]|uniref:hypothetical protein n=1 Tax=unclassified Pseudoxanthomonas TaxID=2645906 RepID=UPI0030786EF4